MIVGDPSRVIIYGGVNLHSWVKSNGRLQSHDETGRFERFCGIALLPLYVSKIRLG